MQINRRTFLLMSGASVFASTSSSASACGYRELSGKTICGYQGWFNAKGDGMDLGFRHYDLGGSGFRPGACSVDLWPDMSELDPDEHYGTPFKFKDGRKASVFSSANAETLRRHYQWMKDYGIHGAALQRFGLSLKGGKLTRMRDLVLQHTRAAANQSGRLWMNMYDISGMRSGQVQDVIARDWEKLVHERNITEDPTYVHHKGKPLVAIWGAGFGGRKYNIHDINELITRVAMGGRFAVMLGVPYFWREQIRDADPDPGLHDMLRRADVISPWSVGRFKTIEAAHEHGTSTMAADIAWCKKAGLHYLPVIFPGYSFRNASQGEKKFNEIPRQRGRFLWAQAEAARRAGAKSIYVAMFDEIDEATAIFKCTNDPPVGESKFLTYEGLPSDHYLWLVGQISRRLRLGKEPQVVEIPKR